MALSSKVKNPSSEELTQLVTLAQSGDQNAFDQLVQKTMAMARRIAASVVGRDLIDDAVQESYLLVVRKIEQLKNPAAFKGWFSRIVLHVCYEARRKIRWQDEISEDHPGEESTDQVVNAIALRQALNRLKSKDRDVLVLRELLGLSYEELAYALRVPLGTVRSRLSSARARLKEAWEPGKTRMKRS